MQTFLFNTPEPLMPEGMVEFYIVSLSLDGLNGKIGIVQEVHGWWNNTTRTATFDQECAPTYETFVSFSDAIDRYCALRNHRANAGFMHSFSWDGFIGNPSNYKPIQPFGESRLRSLDKSAD